MKKLLLLPVFAVFMSFSKCEKSQVPTKPPSKIKESYAQNWIGGQPGVKGTLVTLKLEKVSSSIVFDSIYFNEKVTKLDIKKLDDYLVLTGNFIENTYLQKDLILSSDPREEFGNTPPPTKVEIPFEITKNEAIISYFKDDKKRYFLLKNISKKTSINYQ